VPTTNKTTEKLTAQRMQTSGRATRLTRQIIANALRACTVSLAVAASGTYAQADAARVAYEREDYTAAAALYAPRAAKGDADKDSAAAVRWLTEAARQNHPQAQAELGTMYRLGRGVPEDPKEAARWLRAAASAGVGIAQLSIGRMYRDGVGVERNLVEAYAWFSAAGANNVMDGLAYRAEIASQMSAEQIAEGKERAASLSRKESEAK
jgi:TPR repeat protein